jgi:hypothetical protein
MKEKEALDELLHGYKRHAYKENYIQNRIEFLGNTIKQALEQKKELESKVKEYFNLEQYMNEEPHLITKDAKNEYNDLKKDILNLIGENDG